MTRFTLRDVFWLTLVVAMGVGWWVHGRRQSAHNRQQAEKIRELAHWEAVASDRLRQVEDYMRREGYTFEWQPGPNYALVFKSSESKPSEPVGQP
jgi:hypothetical protein